MADKAKRTFGVSGRVIARKTRRGFAGLRVEACLTLVAILALALMGASTPVGVLVAGEGSTDTVDLSNKESSIMEAYGKLSLLFIENQGQVDEAVRYYVKASGQTVYFTEENIVFDLIRSDGAAVDDTAERLVFSLDFLEANSQPAIEGRGKDGAVVNYFIGNEPEEWHTNVRTYRELVYRDIYPNIDLRLYGNGGMLRYDFVVNPGATPEVIALAYNGIDSLTIVDSELVIGTTFGDIVQSQPHMYQQIGGELVEVEGSFRLDGDNTYGFHVAAYNNHYPLIIDPVLLEYSTYLGGADDDVGHSIAVDEEHQAYITGYTASLDFPITGGENCCQGFLAGDWDAFVTKLSDTGNALVYSTYLGGDYTDVGLGIAVDSDYQPYVTGYTTSSNFPTQNPYQGYVMTPDVFVTKLSPDGSALVYSTYLGGQDIELGHAIAVDPDNYAYVTGRTNSADFPTTQNPYQGVNAGGLYPYFDAFVSKLSQAGNALVYSTYLGGTGWDSGHGIALDSDNHAYVAGYTESTDFPTTQNAYQGANASGGDAFVTKLSPDGSALIYSTYLGGSNMDGAGGRILSLNELLPTGIISNAIAVDSDNHACVTGVTGSTDFPTENPYQGANAGGFDAFVTKVSPDGDALVYSTYLGGSDDDTGISIALDADDNVYVAGHTESLDFPTVEPYQDVNAGGFDVFVTMLSPDGDALVYSTYLGGSDDDIGGSIAADPYYDYAYVTGCTVSANFPVMQPYQGALKGGSDAFVTKLSTPVEECGFATAANTMPLALVSVTLVALWATRRRGRGPEYS